MSAERKDDLTFNEGAIRSALKTLSGTELIVAIPPGLGGGELDRLFGLLQRCGDLFFKYPALSREKRRDKLFDALRAHMAKHWTTADAERVNELRGAFAQVEHGYRGILALLNQASINTESGETRASAMLHRTAVRAEEIRQRAEEAIKKLAAFSFQDDPTAVDEAGNVFSIDAVMAALGEGLRLTLLMLGHQEGWLADDGRLELPWPMPPIDEALIFQIGTTELLASSWRRWETTEQGFRYEAGSLGNIDLSEFPKDWPSDAIAWRYVPDGSVYDWIANERHKEAQLQNFARIQSETSAQTKIAPPDQAAAMPPDQALSLKEINAHGYLSMIIGDDILNDNRRFSDLRLIEWLRGYAALSILAHKAFENGVTSFERHILVFPPGGLEERLQFYGLSADAATALTQVATLCSNSLDLFDTPLIRTKDGGHLLIGPAAIDADPGQIVLSRLNSLDHKLESKGKAFERQVLEFFRKRGFKAFSIDTSRMGEPYEIDVLVPWDGFLFLFECKNRSLSGQHPIQAYYFDQDRVHYIDQVLRQVKGLTDYPDMAIEAGGIDPRNFQIVPCVLYSLPYAMDGSDHGVYVTDWSSLGRFFEERYLYRKFPFNLPGGHKGLRRIGVYSQWSSDTPNPEDLLRQLKDPLQVRLMRARMKSHVSSFLIADRHVVETTEFGKAPLTLDLHAEVFGFDAADVRRQEDEFRTQLPGLLAELQAKYDAGRS